MTRQRITPSPAVVETLAATVGLSLDPERLQALVSHLEAFMEEVTRLEEVDVAGYEPAIPATLPPRRESPRPEPPLPGTATPMTDDRCFLSIRDIGALYRSRRVSPVEVTRAVLDRIDRFGPRLNAWITVRHEDALAEAAAAERSLRAGEDRGPLHGVPISLKDNVDTAGIRTTCGSPLSRNRVPASDATVARRLREAGAVLIGKTNLLEFAYGVVHPAFGQCNNPWDPAHTSGGSSSGSASSVAAGMGYASLGTDTGGSIRIPAAYCGIVGLKPTYGRVSRHGVFPLSWSLDHVGPLTRTVDDARLVLQAIAGPDPADPTTTPQRLTDAAASVADLHGLRVGLMMEHLGEELRPQVAAAFDRALATLRAGGASVREVRVPSLLYSEEATLTLIGAEATSIHEPWLRQGAAENYAAMVRVQLELGAMIPAVDYLRAQRFRAKLMREFDTAFGLVDVIITPTVAHVAPGQPAHPGVAGRGRTRAMKRTCPHNLTGQPAISVPCGTAEDGLPVGLQIIGPRFREDLILSVAAAFEDQGGWRVDCPPGVRSA